MRPRALHQLGDNQTASFDVDYVSDSMWQDIRRLLGESFPEPESRFSILDIGGGNGHFLDGVLADFPAATATLVDNAPLLLQANQPHPRKTIVQESVERLPARLRGRTFDLVCLHWALHHFVLDSYRETLAFQRQTLREAATFLSKRGRLSVFENLYDGWLVPSIPGRLVFTMTRNRRLAPLTRRLGANTAGVGVCFLSERQWLEAFREAGVIVRRRQYYPHSVRTLYRIGLLTRRVRKGHFWLARDDSPPAVLGPDATSAPA
jgi:ubiquinone/menaquinone biosynthesis C-methylase UbiE